MKPPSANLRWPRIPALFVLALAVARGADPPLSAPATNAPAGTNALQFVVSTNGGFAFDTGVLRGSLRAEGKSVGLTDLIHLPAGQRLDHGYGLLSPYRLFTRGRRYGIAAWDMESAARSLTNGAVEVTWPAAWRRPFTLKATYAIISPSAVEVTIEVHAKSALNGFEVFLASYFDEHFTQAGLFTATNGVQAAKGKFVRADRSLAEWLMAPRDDAAVALIRDGRWELLPHRVNWTVLDPFSKPLALRREPKTGVAGVLAADRQQCFAVSMPHEADNHYSVYFSLFGRDFRPGERASGTVRLSLQAGSATEGLEAVAGEVFEKSP